MIQEATTPNPAASPMVAHYAAIKKDHPDCVLLYRVGEFYEILSADANVASRLLNLHLTRRRQKDAPDIPMCGVPSGSMETSVRRLLQAGLKVAICEQAPAPGGERPVCVVTPGTSVDEDVLTASTNNNLVSIDADGVEAGFAWVDLSTGEMGACVTPVSGSGAMLAKLGPSEILITPTASTIPRPPASSRRTVHSEGVRRLS